MGNTTVWLIGEESQPAKRSKRMVGSFLRKSKRKFSQKGEKKENEKWRSFKSKCPKELETSGKPNSPISENINSINRNMPHGHGPRSAATTHLMRHLIPRVTRKKKKKKLSSSMVVMGFHDDQRIGGQLTGLTRSIKDEHSRADEITPKTSPRNTRITDENRVAIQCLQ